MVNTKGGGGGLLGHPELSRPPEHTLLSGIRLNLPCSHPGVLWDHKVLLPYVTSQLKIFLQLPMPTKRSLVLSLHWAGPSLESGKRSLACHKYQNTKTFVFILVLKGSFGGNSGTVWANGNYATGKCVLKWAVCLTPHPCRVKLSCCREGGSGLPWETRQRGVGLFLSWLPSIIQSRCLRDWSPRITVFPPTSVLRDRVFGVIWVSKERYEESSCPNPLESLTLPVPCGVQAGLVTTQVLGPAGAPPCPEGTWLCPGLPTAGTSTTPMASSAGDLAGNMSLAMDKSIKCQNLNYLGIWRVNLHLFSCPEPHTYKGQGWLWEPLTEC